MAFGRPIKRRNDVRMSHDTTSPNRQRPILHLRQANGSTRAGPAERGSTQGTDQERRVAAPREPPAARRSERCASYIVISGHFARSEEHTSDLQSIMTNTYAVLFL